MVGGRPLGLTVCWITAVASTCTRVCRRLTTFSPTSDRCRRYSIFVRARPRRQDQRGCGAERVSAETRNVHRRQSANKPKRLEAISAELGGSGAGGERAESGHGAGVALICRPPNRFPLRLGCVKIQLV